MVALLPHETELIGRWIEIDGKVHGDPVCERIAQLTNSTLEAVGDHPQAGGWVRLFRDMGDGRFWERSYPQSEMHGGGPPQLRCISDNEVEKEYGVRS